jgi:hypothetical protein
MSLNTKRPRSVSEFVAYFLMYILIYFSFLSQFILQNGADVDQHLAYVHGPSMLRGSDLASIDRTNGPGKLNRSPPVIHHHWEVGGKAQRTKQSIGT